RRAPPSARGTHRAEATRMTKSFLAGAAAFALLAAANGNGCNNTGPQPDGGTAAADAPVSGGDVDAGVPVGGDIDAGAPVGGEIDAGTVENDIDAPMNNVPDAPVVAPPGQTDWGPAAGLTEAIWDVSTDEGGNIWAISQNTLYLMTPGAASFVPFGNANGLHIEPFVDPEGNPQTTFLTAVAGGGPNQVYLGYFGYEGSPDPFMDTDQQKQLGNGDRIDYDPATGQLAVHRYG